MSYAPFLFQQPRFSALANAVANATTPDGKIGTAVSTMIPSDPLVPAVTTTPAVPAVALPVPAEFSALQTQLGDANFAALSGTKDATKVAIAALTKASAVAEVKQIADEVTLYDLFALTQLLLRDRKTLPVARVEVYDAIQSTIKQQLREKVCTQPTPCVEKNALECFTSQPPLTITLIIVSFVAIIAIVVAILTAIFRRKCPTPGAGY